MGKKRRRDEEEVAAVAEAEGGRNEIRARTEDDETALPART